MVTRTESQAWRPILRLLVPAAVLGTALGLWQAGVFHEQSGSPVADRVDVRPASVMPGVNSRAADAAADGRSPVGQPDAADVRPPADADEIAEEAALQQALAQEQSNGG